VTVVQLRHNQPRRLPETGTSHRVAFNLLFSLVCGAVVGLIHDGRMGAPIVYQLPNSWQLAVDNLSSSLTGGLGSQWNAAYACAERL
jgi:hypothetical protein